MNRVFFFVENMGSEANVRKSSTWVVQSTQFTSTESYLNDCSLPEDVGPTTLPNDQTKDDVMVHIENTSRAFFSYVTHYERAMKSASQPNAPPPFGLL